MCANTLISNSRKPSAMLTLVNRKYVRNISLNHSMRLMFRLLKGPAIIPYSAIQDHRLCSLHNVRSYAVVSK